MVRQMAVRPSPTGFRETEVQPFPIGESPAAPSRSRPEHADRILRAGVTPFEFRAGPHAASAARVTSLDSFADTLAVVPLETLEFAVYGGGIERWVGEAIGDEDLRREITGIRALARHGEPLRTLLYTLVKSRQLELARQ